MYPCSYGGYSYLAFEPTFGGELRVQDLTSVHRGKHANYPHKTQGLHNCLEPSECPHVLSRTGIVPQETLYSTRITNEWILHGIDPRDQERESVFQPEVFHCLIPLLTHSTGAAVSNVSDSRLLYHYPLVWKWDNKLE